MNPNNMLPPRIFSLVDMLAERTDPLSRYMMKVDMIDHVCLILVFFGTNFAKPSAPLKVMKVMAVIDSICKTWKRGQSCEKGK